MLKVGDKISASKPFTSPIGVHFSKDAVFTVEIVGSKSVKLRADQCGSVVWLSDGLFLRLA